MVNFVARSNVYPAHLPIPISIDVHIPTVVNLSVQVFLLSAASTIPVLKTDAVSKTILVPTTALALAAAAAGPSGWVSLAFRLVSIGRLCECIADDCLDMRLIRSPDSATAAFGFDTPTAAHRPPPPMVHFVHLALDQSHQRQLTAVRTGRAAVAGATAAQTPPRGCNDLLLMAVRAAERAYPGSEIFLHTDQPEDGPAACTELQQAVRVVAIIAPQAVGGRPVRWHQHQADVVCTSQSCNCDVHLPPYRR